MPQSLVKNYMHLIYSTKHRDPLIKSNYEDDLHGYLGGICANMECHPIKIGGHTDHVHVLCLLSKKVALISLLEELKSESSKWMKTLDEPLKNFFWQKGYGAFSVSPTHVDAVIDYIARQHEHHRKVSFQDEFRALMKKYKIDFDERYVWD